MPVKNFKFDGLLTDFEKKQNAYLHGAGQLIQNQMVEFAHIDTGTLKNSITYKLQDSTGSEFGSVKGATPPAEAKINPADRKDHVRVGSALTYAQSQEKANGWATRGFDTVIATGNLEKLAEKIFGVNI